MCANITKKFEQQVARDLWGQARASYNAPTRRKKEQAKSFVLKDPKGVGADLTVLAHSIQHQWFFIACLQLEYYWARTALLIDRANGRL